MLLERGEETEAARGERAAIESERDSLVCLLTIIMFQSIRSYSGTMTLAFGNLNYHPALSIHTYVYKESFLSHYGDPLVASDSGN